MKRTVYIPNENIFKEANIIGKREIFVNNEILDVEHISFEKLCRILDVDERNMLSEAIDMFEEGGNHYIDGYEVFNYNIFTIKRKVKLV